MFLIVSARSEFIARWRPPFERVGGFVTVRPSLAEAADVVRPWMMVVDVAGLPADWAPPDPALAALAGGGRILLAGRDFSVDEELKALGSGISGCCAESLGELELKNVVEGVLKGGIWNRPNWPWIRPMGTSPLCRCRSDPWFWMSTRSRSGSVTTVDIMQGDSD